MRPFHQTRVYLDYASAPPVLAAAEKAAREASLFIGNPGGIHREAVEAARSLEGSRSTLARLLEVKPRELVFTSGLTESNNLAILGAARSLERVRRTLSGTHWLVSAIEHSSVLDCFGEIERMGGEVGYVRPNAQGIVTPESVERAIKPSTVFVSVGWANNEIGTIQPLTRIARVIRAHARARPTSRDILFHSDAGQAPLYLPSTAHSLGVDLLSIGSNKLYGPHGIGALYIGPRADIARILFGGPQERGLRAGTENVALAAGFATAYEHIASERGKESERLRALRGWLAQTARERIPGLIVNGDLRYALPHMLNISVPNIQSEYVTLALDREGFAVSTKSACREGEERESHVVAALGGEPWRARNTLRISLGRETRRADVERFADTLVRAVSSLSPGGGA